jgi:general secretion pathway protein K
VSKGGRSSGAILVAVLWTIALLSGLAMAASTTFRTFVGVMSVHGDRLKADALFTAGLEVAAGVIGRMDETPLRDLESRLALPGGTVQVRLADEGGRIDAGKAPAELLASLFRSLGARDADGIAQRISAWRTADDGQPRPGTSEEEPQLPPEAEWPFSDVRQLARIPGVPPEVVAAAAPLLTVYGNVTVNPLTAPPEVVAALPGIDASRLRSFLEMRRRFPTDAPRLQAALGPAQQYAAASPRRAVSVHLTATLEDGFAAAALAVIVVFPNDREPYRILSWKPLGSAGEDRPGTSN